MIKLGTGKHPVHGATFFTASGGLAFDGKGWWWERILIWLGLMDPSLAMVITKTLTREPRKGNLRMWWPWGCIRLLRGGVLNAVGLTNPSFDWWCAKVAPRLDFHRPIVVSIMGTVDELVEMARKLNEYDLAGIEINASCPNTGGDDLTNIQAVIDGCKAVYEVTRHPIVLKLSVAHGAGIETIVKATEGLVAAYGINSVPWSIVYPDKKSPLAHLGGGGGGVSGQVVQEKHTWPLARRISRLTTVPVIWPSVWSMDDMLRMIDVDCAKAIAFGAISIIKPWGPTLWMRRYLATHLEDKTF